MKPAFTLACCVALSALQVAHTSGFKTYYLGDVARKRPIQRSSNPGKDQWWIVKLDQVYRLDHLVIWNVRGEFEHNIDGSELWIGKEGTFTKCSDIPDVGGCWNARWIKCPMDGDEVKITQAKETSGIFLHKVRVEVWVSMRKKFAKNYDETIEGEKYNNVAFYRETSQSSDNGKACTSWNICAKSDRAVDGLYNMGMDAYAVDQCSLTNVAENNWWMVKLDTVYTIKYVTIWNLFTRSHSAEVINSAIIWVGKTGKKFKKCTEITGFPRTDHMIDSRQTKLFQCQKERKGNTVKITLAKKAALGLTEVLVWVKASEVEKKKKKKKINEEKEEKEEGDN